MNIGKCVTEFLNSGQILCWVGASLILQCTPGGGGGGEAYTLIFLLEFANNIHLAEIMGIQQHRPANG